MRRVLLPLLMLTMTTPLTPLTPIARADNPQGDKPATEPAMGVYGAFAASKEWTPPADPLVLEKIRKWQDQKIGILIHWGTYSQWGIVESWTLVTTKHEWNHRPAPQDKLSDADYQKTYENLITTFNPTKFDPDKWAAGFKEGGAKYILPMTKHHDGFCMWDTPTTDYKITGATCPFKNDPRADTVKLIADACRKQDLSVGLYFSKADWHSPFYWKPELGPGSGQGPNYDPTKDAESWKKFKDFTWTQIEELMKKYGQVDILWLDGGAVRSGKTSIDMNGMAAMARTHQPGLIVVDRTVHGPNENYVTPEGEIPKHHLPYPWETCMPLGTSWTWKPHDQFKSTATLVRNLTHIVARGGNYLIGVGPDANGELDPGVYESLKNLGAWLKINGEAIYETRSVAPYESGNVFFTQKKDGTIYAIILPEGDSNQLPDSVTLPTNLMGNSPTLLGSDVLLPMSVQGERSTITFPKGLQANPPCQHGWVLKLPR